MSSTVRRMLATKEKGVWTIEPTTTIRDAVALMLDKDVGALVVLEAQRVVGIVTERDLVRRVLAQELDPATTPVREVMTSRVLYVRPDNSMEDCMALMNEKHIRHLPVLDGEQLLGIVSIRDAIKQVVAEREFIIEQLENYILDRRDYENPAGPTSVAPIGR